MTKGHGLRKKGIADDKYRKNPYNESMRNRRLKKRIKHFEKELEEARSERDHEKISFCTESLIYAYEKAELHNRSHSLLMECGSEYLDCGETDKAVNYYREALLLSREYRESANTVESLIKLGSCYLQAGDYPSAEKFLVGALHEAREKKEAGALFYPLYHLGELYEKQGRMRESLTCFTKAVQTLPDTREGSRKNIDLLKEQTASRACLSAADLYSRSGKGALAIEWFTRASETAAGAGTAALREYSSAEYHLAGLEIREGNLVKAENRLAALLQFCRGHDLDIDEALTTILLVKVRLKTGSSAGSLPLLQEQVDKIRKAPGKYPPECYLVFKLIGEHCKYFLKDQKAADRYFALFTRMSGGVWEKYLTE